MSANKIRELREERGLTQDELARRIGTTAPTVSRLEMGRRRLTQDYMMSISRALGVDPADLVGSGLPPVASSLFIHVVGDVAQDLWRVPTKEDAADYTTIPVVLPQRLGKFAGSAWRVTDDHADWLVGKDGYVISVPVESLRKTPLDGDILVVRSKEGRMERTMVARAKVDSRGVMVDLGEGEVNISSDNWSVGIVVAAYRELG